MTTMKLLNLDEVQHAGVKYLNVEPQVVKFRLQGKNILYDENSMMLWEVDDKVYKRSDLNQIGARQKPYFDNNLNQPNWRMIVFQSTYACNLDCDYCFVTHHYVNHSNRLHLDVALKAIDKYQPPSAKQSYNIGFFGGEPLMNWKTIYKIIEEVKERGKKHGLGCQFHITTNATLVTPEMADYFSKNSVSFIVSLDGPEGFHDNNRPYHDGGGTWKDVMRGLELLASAYHRNSPDREVPITLRSTFDKKGVDLVECLDFLNQLMRDGLASHVSVEPASLGESCSTDSASLDSFEIEELRAMFEPEYWSAARWFLDEIRKGHRPSFHHFEVPLQRIYDRKPSVAECGAGKGYISIGPGGTISACHREHGALIGNLFEGGIDPTLQAKWLDNRLYNRTTCPDCWRRNLCGGGCRANSVLINDNLNVPSVVECLFKEMETLPVFWLLAVMTEKEKAMYTKQPRTPINVGAPISPQGLVLSNKVNEMSQQQNPNNSVQTWQIENKYSDQETIMPQSTVNMIGKPPLPKTPTVDQVLKIQQPGDQVSAFKDDKIITMKKDDDVPDWVNNQLDSKHETEPVNIYDDDDEIDEKTKAKLDKQKAWTNPDTNMDKYSNRPTMSDEEEGLELSDSKECCKNDPEKSCGCKEDEEPAELEIGQ